MMEGLCDNTVPIKRLARPSESKLRHEDVREAKPVSIDWPEDVLTRLLASAPELRLVRRGQEQRKGERVFGIDFSAALKEAGMFDLHSHGARFASRPSPWAALPSPSRR